MPTGPEAETQRVLDDATRADIASLAEAWALHPSRVLRSMIRTGLAVYAAPPTGGRETVLLDHLTAYLAVNGWTPGNTSHHESAAAVVLWYHPGGLAAAIPRDGATPGFEGLYRAAIEQVAGPERIPITTLAAALEPAAGRS
jgi:hypothetical protein